MAPSPSNRYGLRPSPAKRPWTNMSRSASLARLCCCCAVFIVGPLPFDWFEKRELVLVSFFVCLLLFWFVFARLLFLLKFLFFKSCCCYY